MATYLGRFLILAKLASEWSAANPVLMNGELGVSDPGSATPILKVGDGLRPWSALPPISGAGGGGAGSPDYVVGTTTTLAPGAFATVEIDNAASPPTISFGIPRGNTGPPNTLTIGTTSTGAPGSPASATITGVSPNQTLNLTIPQGPVGPQGIDGSDGAPGPMGPAGPAGGPVGPAGPAGPPNTLTIGTVDTGAPGSAADATITGTAPDQVLNLTIPTGAPGPDGAPGPAGPPNTLVIGTVTTGTPGSAADVTITGTAPNQTLNMTIPAGADGAPGAEGPMGPAGPTSFADPTAEILLVMQPGDSTAAMRSDAAPALSQAIAPTWTGAHRFDSTVNLFGTLQASGVDGVAGQVLSTQGAGLPPVWRTSSGGSIELGYNFSTSVGTANPGSQKMSLNSAVYASVTIAVFNALAMTNFDANTILSLLTTGNRIYIQQRNDASKAVVYEVTGPGTNMTGYWTIPVTLIQSRGTIFTANADLNVVFILSVSSTSLANPTALVGLAAVDGSATTGMRSDAAPALDQAIAPVWTGQHTFSSPGQVTLWSGSSNQLRFTNTGQATDEKNWSLVTTAKLLILRANNDAFSAPSEALRLTRATGSTIGTMDFGNVASGTNFNFLGAGLTTYSGSMVMGAATGGSKGVGTINATGLYVNGVAVGSGGGTPGGSTTQIQYNNAGAFAGDADFTWDSSANKLTVGSLATPGFVAGVDGASTAGLTVRAGDSTANSGSTLTIRGGNTSNVGSQGGAVNITGGVPTGGGAGNGGAVSLASGSSAGSGTGGAVDITGGNSVTNAGGVITIKAGNTSGAGAVIGAAVNITGGNSGTTPGWPGGAVTLIGGAGGAAASGNNGGAVTSTGGAGFGINGNGGGTSIAGGLGAGIGDGGSAILIGGQGGATGGGGGGIVRGGAGGATSGPGGALTMRGGHATAGGSNGGNLTLNGGNATTSGIAGLVSIGGGVSPSGTGGYIVFSTGAAALTERLRFLANGAWSVGSAGTDTGTSGQVLTSAGGAAPPTWSTPAAGVSAANPTASVGLAAVNGSAGTFLRSDGAPALSQAIAPTWTALHTFSNSNDAIRVTGNSALLGFQNTAAAADQGRYRMYADPTAFILSTLNDAASVARAILNVARGSGAAVSSISFGNATDNNTYNFLGTGLTTYSGPIVMGAPSGGSQGAGTINATGLYVNGVAVSTSAGAAAANPTASVGLAAVNGSAGTFMRSDAAPALSVSISPTWSGTHTFNNTVTASAFAVSSSRALKRETGRLARARDVLSRLRPILYRMLAGDEREQLGLIAEEVHEVCPLLSDGKTVSYDRVALLLLADWQERQEAA